jgi:hypothetical protein
MYPLYMPFFNLIQFYFQINDYSVIVIPKNRRFGDKNATNQKMQCIMDTGSYRKIFCNWKRIESMVMVNTWYERVLRKNLQDRCRDESCSQTWIQGKVV